MSIARSAAVMTGLAILGHVIALVVQVVFARIFGAGWMADAWFAALAVPTFFTFAIFASLGKAMLPVFVQERGEKGEEAFHAVAGLANQTFIGLGIVAALISLFSEEISLLLFPSFDAERFELAQNLVAISIWAIPATGTSIVLGTAFHGVRRFGWPAVAMLWQPIGVLLSLVFLRERFGIACMAFGFVFGCWAQLLTLVPLLLRKRRYRAGLLLNNPAVRSVYGLFPMLLLAAACAAAYPLIEKRFASGITDPAVGPISWLGYARRPVNLLLFLLIRPGLVTSFTALAELAAAGDLVKLRNQSWRASASMLMVIAPFALILGILAPELVGIVFERGEFTALDTHHTAMAIRCLIPLALFAVFERLFAHAFFARRKPLVPVATSLAVVALYVLLGGFAAKRWGYPGLALLQSGGFLLVTLVIGAVHLKQLGAPRGERIPGSLTGITIAGICCATALLSMKGLVPAAGEPLVLRAGLAAVTAAVAIFVYLGVLAMLRNPHLALVLRSLLGKKKGSQP